MTSKENVSVRKTGGQVDEMAMALIDAANDKDPRVRQIIATSLIELGKKQPELLLTSCLVYLQKHAKLSHNHKIQILEAMENIIKNDEDTIKREVILQVIEQISREMTSSKDPISELQQAASAVIVSCGRRYCIDVMADLLNKFQPGILPHITVVETLANLAITNVFGMVPFIKACLGTMLPMLGMAKNENMKYFFATVLSRFSEAILDYIANIEKAPDPAVCREAFAAEINNAFDVLLNVWIQSRESRLRVAVVEALGQMSQVLVHQKLEEVLPRLVSTMLAMYKKHSEPYHITLGLCMVLDAATKENNLMLEPHFEQINAMLFPQICQTVDFTKPLSIKNHNEVLRCYAILARSFSDRLVSFCIQRLDTTNEKVHIGVLTVVRHLINSAAPHMEDKKPLLISGLRVLLNEPNNKVKKVLAQAIIAMGHHGYLELEGGQNMIKFIIQQCSLPAESAGKRPMDPDYVSNDALKLMCVNVIQLLSTTVDGMDKVLWPYILEFLVNAEYTKAMTVLCQSISHLAAKKKESGDTDFDVNFQKHVNLPRPQAIFARLLVLAGWPKHHQDRVPAVLNALNHLGPNLNEYTINMWNTVLPKLIQHLTDVIDSDKEWNQQAWEDLVLKFLAKSLDEISDEEWIVRLAEDFGNQISLYQEERQQKNFLYKCLGLTLKKLGRKDVVNKHLDIIFNTVKHSEQVEREGCAVAVGFTSATHLDCVLTKLEYVGKLDPSKKSNSLLNFIKETVNIKSEVDDRLSATVMLCYGYVTLYAPKELLVSRMEPVLARVILPQLESVKDSQVKINLILAVDLIARAMHPDYLGHKHQFSLRLKLLHYMQKFILAEKQTQLTNEIKAYALKSAASLVQLDPVLHMADQANLLNCALDGVLMIPLGGDTGKPAKEDTYQEHVEFEHLMRSTKSALEDLLNQVCIKDSSPKGLLQVITVLHPWICSENDGVREYAMQLTLSVLGTHLQHVDAVKAGSGFTCMGSILGWLIPRCSDSVLGVSHAAIDSVQTILNISLKYDASDDHETRPTLSPLYAGSQGSDKTDGLTNTLSSLKTRLNHQDPNALYSAVSDLGKIIQRKTPPDQLRPLLESLYDGLKDKQSRAASGACVVLNVILKARGGELHSQVEKITEDLLTHIENITNQQTRTGTLRCVCLLASHHSLPVISHLLQQPLPLSRHVEECWNLLGHDHVLTLHIIDYLLEQLARVLPYEEKPDPQVKDGTMRVSTLQPMAITCALLHLCHADEVQSTVMENYPRLLCATMIRIASTVGAKPPRITKEELRDKRTVTVTREIALDPCISAIHACQQIIRSCMSDEFIASVSTAGVWNMLAVEEEFMQGFTLFARCMVEKTPEHVGKVITHLTPSMGSVYAPQRIMTAAVFAEFLSHRCMGDLGQVELLTNSFLGRLVDSDHRVRMLCVRGLGNVSSAGPDQVTKYATTVLSAMMSGMDDKDDTNDDITLEAMEGLSKILQQINEDHIRAILINIALRIRPCFEKDKPAVRAAAITLFGNLSRFCGGPSREPFLEQIHTNLISLLLHLHDPNPEVIKASKRALRDIGPLLGSDGTNSMFQKHLLGEGSLLYGEFINDLAKVLLLDFPEKANFYLMAAINFFKSEWPEIKSNAAMFTGFLLGNMSKEMYVSISREHICNALVLLLKDPSPEVRIKAAEAISWLHDL